jgi:hypothetical protein
MVGLVIVAGAQAGDLTTTGWIEYASNPVYSPGKAYYPSVIDDGGTYKMWSTKSGGIQYATSSDGVTWSASQDATTGLTNPHHVLVEKYDTFTGANSGENASAGDMNYRMWYWDTGQLYSIADIRYAESSDGLTWNNDQPIAQVGSTVIDNSKSSNWNRGSYGPADVIYNPSGSSSITQPTDEASVWANKFVMYYDGTTGGDESLGLAVSNDGITWEGYNGGGAPVLAGTGVSGDWDEDYVSRATVIKEDEDAFHMWFSGGLGSMDDGIGYASSSDGINWTRDSSNPIFHKDDGQSWRSDRTYCPMVIGDEMWFTGKSGSGAYTIGYATPEPATLALLAVGGGLALLRRRRKV